MNNPLSQYYTQPGTFAKLPSGGRYYSTPPVTTSDGEIEIRPMNAIDELQFQNPDGLLNNDSLVKVLQKTVPGIANANEILKPDLDVLLIALRIVTYGENMDVNTKCRNTECGHEETYQVNLVQMLHSAKPIPEDNSVKLGDLTVYVKPFTISSQNRLNEYMIDVQRTARMLQKQNIDNDEEAIEALRGKMAGALRDSAYELFMVASDSIMHIVLPDGTDVKSKEQITEWLTNIKAPDYAKIRDTIGNLSREVVNREFKFKCQKCETENKMQVDFDPANFFAAN